MTNPLHNHVNLKADEYRKAGYKVKDMFLGNPLSHFTTISHDGKIRRHTFRPGVSGMEHLGDTGVTGSGETKSAPPIKRGRGRPRKDSGPTGGKWMFPPELAKFGNPKGLPKGKVRTVKMGG